MRVIAAAVALLAAAPAAEARPGDLDRGFGNGGRIALGGLHGARTDGLALSERRRPLLSTTYGIHGPTVGFLHQLTASGRLARRTSLSAPAVEPPLLASGYALTRAGHERYTLGRIGRGDTVTLAIPDDGSFARVGAFGVDGAGRAVLIVRYATRAGSSTYALRFRPDGTLDQGYGRALLGDRGTPTSVLVRRDGRAYVAVPAAGGLRMIALDAAGRRLAGFRTARWRGARFGGRKWARAVIAGPGGRLLVAGGTDFAGWITRLHADGRVDRRFGDNGFRRLPDLTANAIVRDRRGRIVVAGLHFEPSHQAAVMRLTARGRGDGTFGRRGTVRRQIGARRGVYLVASEARFLAIDDRDRIVVAGESYDANYVDRDDSGESYPAIARFLG